VFTECQILFHSTQYSLLLFVQEAILSLCFPFQWEHVYIPLLPKVHSERIQRSALSFHSVLIARHFVLTASYLVLRVLVVKQELLNVIQAPVPFIVGIHTDILPEDLDDLWQSSQVVVVDIDRSEIDSNMPPPFFPKQQARTLTRSLMGLIRPQVFTADMSLHPSYMGTLNREPNASPIATGRAEDDVLAAVVYVTRTGPV